MEFRRLEQVVEDGLKTFLEVGSALVEIRDGRLYRGAYPSFDDYCRSRWGMSKTHANRLIASAETVKLLGDVDVLPANEAQVRPLTLLPAELQSQAWERAVASVGNAQRLTASAVAAVVEEMMQQGKATVHRAPPHKQVQFVDKVRLIKDLEEFCERHQLVLPKRVIDFLKKY